MFKTTYGKRKVKPNRLQKDPVIAIHSKLNSETLGYIKKLSTKKEKSKFINQAIEMKYFLIKNKKQFLKQMIQEDYELCRYLLRKIGNEKSMN